MSKERTLNIIVFMLLLFLFVVFLIYSCPIALQNDTLYDIKLGERYFTQGMFHIDNYTFHTGLIYQTHHYLVCIIDYLIYNIFSLKGLYYLEIFLTSIIGLMFYLLNRTLIKNKFLTYILLFFQIISLSSFISLRAQMYSYIIFMIEILIIEKYLNKNRRKYIVLLTLLPLLLVNLHSGVIYFYFIIFFTYFANGFNINIGSIMSDKRVGKNQLKAFSLSIIIGGLLTLINPYGINGLTYGLKTLNSYYISNYITEFQPINLFTPMGILMIIYISVCIICLLLSNRKIRIQELLLFLGTTFMALLSVRHFSLLIITSVTILPHVESAYKKIDSTDWSFKKSLAKGINLMNIIVLTIYIIISSYFVIDIVTRSKEQLSNKIYPIEATNYIKQNLNENDRIFNLYEWGSYLMFNDVLTFIDSRCDLFNEEYNEGVTVMKDYIDVMNNKQNYDLLVSKYNIDYFMIYKKSRLVKKMLSNSNNRIVYSDKLAVIIKVTK